MRFTAISAAAALAFASSVLAQTTGFNSIAIPVSVDAGKTTKISWTAPTFTDSDVKVELIGGADFAHLVPIQVIVPSIKNSALGYDWTVASELGKDATYGIRISLVSDPSTFQYSNAFKIVGGTVAVSSSTSASASASGYPVSVPTTSATVIVSVTSSVVISSSVVVVPTVSSSVVVPATTSAVIPATTSTAAAATLTTLTSAISSGASATTTGATAVVSTAAGAQATAGVVALFGGLAAALMAM